MTKRANSEGSVLQMPGGRWRVRLQIDGRRRSAYADTKREADQILTQFKTERDQGLPLGGDQVTVQQLMERWLEDIVKPYRAPGTYINHAIRARKHVYPALGTLKVRKLTPHRVQRLLTEKEKELSAQTVVHIRNTLSGALTYGMRWGVVNRNVARMVDLPDVPKPDIQPVDVHALSRLVAELEEDQEYGAFFYTSLFTGMRSGELKGLVWGAIDFEKMEAYIRQSVQRVAGAWVVKGLKTGKSEAILPLSESTVAVLEKHRAWCDLNLPPTEWAKRGFVFLRPDGYPIHQTTLRHRFHAHLAKVGLDEMRPHDLRHMFATTLIASGESPKDVQEALRHSSVSTTLDIYTHLFKERRRATMQRMDQQLFG